MLCKVTHCAGCVSANTRPHQLRWGDREMGTAISCIKYSQVTGFIQKVGRSSYAHHPRANLLCQVYAAKNVQTWYISLPKVLLRVYFRNWISTAVASGQYHISTHISVSDLYEPFFVELIHIGFTVRYETCCQKVPLRFWVQIWIRLVLVLIQNVRFCYVWIPYSVEFSQAFNFTKFQLLAKFFQWNFEK